MEIQTTLCQDVQSGRQFAVRCGGVAGMRYCLLAILLFLVQTICAQVSHQFRKCQTHLTKKESKMYTNYCHKSPESSQQTINILGGIPKKKQQKKRGIR